MPVAAQVIEQLFEVRIRDEIREVVKVAQDRQDVVHNEIREYIATKAIQQAYTNVFERMNAAIGEPTDAMGIWISGFFGSGKSSFAKILGFLLENPVLGSDSASELFKRRIADNRRLRDLLALVNQRLPVTVVMFDILESVFVRTQGEPVREVMYRAFLQRLGYSDDIDVAELEIDLESRGLLVEFQRRYEERHRRPWEDGRRDRSFVLFEASAVLNDMDPKTYTATDYWASNRKEVNLETEQFAERCFELMERRSPGHALVFIIDEVGQYVSRSDAKMQDLQGVIQAFGRIGHDRARCGKGHQAWIAVTAQEKLDEVVDAIGSRQIDLAKLQARFATQIDLVPADISEVASQRVLRKTPDAEKLLEARYDENRGRVQSLLKWTGTARGSDVSKEAFKRLYPFPPHFIDLSIDIVTGIRLQPGAMRHIGGSNRTIIKQAQQVLIHPEVSLATKPVGDLVTLDMLYELLRPSLSTERWKEIHDIEERIEPKAFLATKVAKAITLLEFVRDLPRTPENIAACLWPRLDAEPVLDDVVKAIGILERHQFVRFDAESGYKLQSTQEKAWTKERENIELKPKQRRELLVEKLGGVFGEPRLRTFRLGGLRTLKVGFLWEEARLSEAGEVVVKVIVADAGDESGAAERAARQRSDLGNDPSSVFWVVGLDDGIESLLRQLYQSREMCARHIQQQAAHALLEKEAGFLNEEKARKDRLERDLKNDLAGRARIGRAFFRGIQFDLAGLGEGLPEIGQALLSRTVPGLFPKFQMAARQVTGKEAIALVTATSLAGLPPLFLEGSDGLGLVQRQGDKWVIDQSAETAKEVLSFIRDRHGYGERVDGRVLENRFTGLGYAWDPDLLKAVLAALVRGGAIEVVHGGRRLRRAGDPGLRDVFAKVLSFRAASFVPRETLDLRTLTTAARHLEAIVGDEVEIDEDSIARRIQVLARASREELNPTYASVRALELPGADLLEALLASFAGLLDAPPDDCARTFADVGQEIGDQLRRARTMRKVVEGDGLRVIRQAKATLSLGAALRGRIPDDDPCFAAMRRLEDALGASTFAERLSDIATDSGTVASAFGEFYEALHERRRKTYAAAIESIKALPVWGGLLRRFQSDALARGLGVDQAKSATTSLEADVLRALVERSCAGGALDIVETPTCPICHHSVERIESDIDSVDVVRETVARRVLDLAEPPEEVERVSVASFFPSAALQDEGALEDAISRLRQHLMRLVRDSRRFRIEA